MCTLEEKCVVHLVLSEFQDEENCINNVTLEKPKGIQWQLLQQKMYNINFLGLRKES